jgi:hypothetical protein
MTPHSRKRKKDNAVETYSLVDLDNLPIDCDISLEIKQEVGTNSPGLATDKILDVFILFHYRPSDPKASPAD